MDSRHEWLSALGLETQAILDCLADELGVDAFLPVSTSPNKLSTLLEQWGERGDVQVRTFDAPADLAVSSVTADRPLVGCLGGGSYILIVDRVGKRVCVRASDRSRHWVTLSEVVKRAGLRSEREEMRWFALNGTREVRLDLVPKKAPWSNARELLRHERPSIAAVLLYALGVGLFSLVLPLTVQTLVNTVAFGQLLQPLVVLTILLAGGLAFVGGLRGAQAWVVEILQRRIFVRLVSQLSARLPRVRVELFERKDGADLANRFFDVFLAQKALASLLLVGVEALLIVSVGLAVLSLYHPLLLGFGLVLMTVFGLVVFVLLGRGATKTSIAESKAKYAVAAWLEEMTRHLVLLKSPGGRAYAQRQLDALASTWVQAREQHYRVYFRQYLGALALQAVAHGALLGLGGWLVINRSLTLGQLVAAELIVAAVVGSLHKLVGKLESVYDFIASADKLSELLALPLEREGGEEAASGAQDGVALQLVDVEIADSPCLGMELTLTQGQVKALRCDRQASGALSEVLFGLRSPESGVVYLRGNDLRDLSLSALRAEVQVVSSGEVLPGTIAQNLRAVRRGGELNSKALWSALRRVGLEDRVRALPDGLNTMLLGSGAPFSRRDTLLLTLARAILAAPRVLVLDGVLDTVSEEARPQLLHRLRGDWALLVLTESRYTETLCLETPRSEAGPNADDLGQDLLVGGAE